jgi:hypothetical protein
MLGRLAPHSPHVFINGNFADQSTFFFSLLELSIGFAA